MCREYKVLKISMGCISFLGANLPAGQQLTWIITIFSVPGQKMSLQLLMHSRHYIKANAIMAEAEAKPWVLVYHSKGKLCSASRKPPCRHVACLQLTTM